MLECWLVGLELGSPKSRVLKSPSSYTGSGLVTQTLRLSSLVCEKMGIVVKLVGEDRSAGEAPSRCLVGSSS